MANVAKGERERGRGCFRGVVYARWRGWLIHVGGIGICKGEEERGRVCDERMVSLENLVYLDGNDGAIGGCAGIGPIPKAAATRSILTSLLTNGSKIWLTVEYYGQFASNASKRFVIKFYLVRSCDVCLDLHRLKYYCSFLSRWYLLILIFF